MRLINPRVVAVLAMVLICCTPATITARRHYLEGHSPTLLTYSEPTVRTERPSPDEYQSQREKFFRYEESKALGAELELNERELLANQIIMEIKNKEYEEGLVTPHLFKPSQHFFKVLEQIRASPLFEYMAAMPKGGALHAHDTALSSTDYLIKETYRADLWVCQGAAASDLIYLKFSKSKPTDVTAEPCDWQLLTEVRKKHGAEAVDQYLRERMTMYPTEKFLDINVAWKQFMTIFSLIDGLLTYAPIWGDYYYNALEEFAADGVQYLEFRTTLPTLYDLEGNAYTSLDTVRIYTETLAKFMATHEDFIGSKMIYAPVRHTDAKGINDYIRICLEIKEKYPDFVAGFDLVGQEELGGPLKDFIPQLLSMPDHINFYFHAGETNWYGSSVDENVVDAILLGTKRIGHGFALIKHPLAMQMLKERNIPVEINPISNQVLQLVSDYRNHPCSHYFADNYTIVISSDDPSFWKAAPLSHDFYIAFLGIASAHADMRLLKKLALNSLEYSSLAPAEKVVAMNKWQLKWDAFIERVISGEDSGANDLLPSYKHA